MQKLGVVLLTIWAGLNLLLAIGIVASMVLLGRHPPSLALYVDSDVASHASTQLLALIDALGVFANACAAGFCALALVLIWRRCAWASLAVTCAFVQACGFASDAYLGHGNIVVNVGSSAILAGGLILTRRSRSIRC